ncbi:MAG: tRNA (adenosine(37)-N6)-threonylcarbamoyltransferase complex dimerization subunit type 1 TsaB [Rubritalea sp.]|tara:strand:+ start:205 stop:903 length:699 start_codon:yes stop_codon:yes gene_type:complete
MSIILSIETSIPEASVALTIDGKISTQQEFESHRQQNKLLFPALESVLAKLPKNKSPDLIIVGTGPGSYSGSRISIAAAQGLAIAYSCPVVGLCSFLGTHTMSQHTTAYAIGDARRDTYFIAKIQQNRPEFQPGEPELLSLDDFCKKLSTIDTSLTPLFSFEKELPMLHVANYIVDKSHAAQLTKVWLELSSETQQSLLQTPPQPAYLRAPFITKAKPGHPLLRKNKSGLNK